MKKTMRKCICGVLAAIGVFGCGGTLGACTTAHPEVTMEIEFNGVTYSLEYLLYRNVAPATVSHFLWLADNGYYDGLCVHDYDDGNSRMHTGVYAAGTEVAAQLTYKNYYETVATYDNYKDFPHSVWQKEDKTLPTYTLKGEFEDNDFIVENGALQETLGSLTMYYESIDNDDAASTKVWFADADGKDVSKRSYEYNCATSAFFISFNENAKTNNQYCTFATLKVKSEETFANLQTAITEYIEDNYNDGDDFTQDIEMEVFQDDAIVQNTEREDYDVPKTAIVVKKVTVTRY